MLTFVDTNVFVYSLFDSNSAKVRAARVWRDELWRLGIGRTSFQVLVELYVNVVKKMPDLEDQVRAEIEDLFAWKPIAINDEVVKRAWKIRDRYKLSYWDSLICACSTLTSCTYLLTEDLQHGQVIDGVEVVNPFLAKPNFST